MLENDRYYIAAGEDTKGPYALSQLENMWKSGSITANTLYCQEGFEGWVPVERLFHKPAEAEEVVSEKRIFPAIVLCFFLGAFGAHSFYAGRRKQGISILACLLIPVLVFTLPMFVPKVAEAVYFSDSRMVFLLYSAVTYLPLVFVGVHVLCDLVRLLVGSYKDGRGVKITKWT